MPTLQLLPDLLAAHATMGTQLHRASSSATDTDPLIAVAALTTASATHTGSRTDSSGLLPSSSTASQDCKEPALLYLRGLREWSLGRKSEGLALLERSVQALLSEAERWPLGLELFGELEVARVLGVVRRLVGAAGADPRQSGEVASPVLAKSVRCVRLVVLMGG